MSNNWLAKDMKSNAEYEMENEPTAMEGELYDNGEVAVIQGFKNSEPINDSCWNQFSRKIRSIWATKQTEDLSENKSLYIGTTIRELVIYLFFLGILITITFGMRIGYMYWYTNQLKNLFLNGQFNDNSGSFLGMNAHSDFWKFLIGPLLNGLYWNVWYNGKGMDNNELNFIFYENKLLGVPRLRQVRMANSTCIVAPKFRSKIVDCYATYSINSESKDSFGLKNSTAWTYTAASALETNSFQGSITTYSGGGFYMDLTNDLPTSLNIILGLYKNMWTDRGTRAVMVDFTVYNVNINLFCIIKLVAEFPAVGGILASSEFQTVKLIRYVNSLDYFILACEIIFVLLIIYYIIEEIIEIWKHRVAYLYDLWNVLDIIVLILCVVCTIFNVYRSIVVTNVLDKILLNNKIYANFDNLGYRQLLYDNLTAFTVFLATAKIFKYISFNKMMTQLIATLNYCVKDLIGFALMFFIIFLAYAQAGYLIFGTQLANFREFHICIYTLFRIILNDCNFKELQNTNSFLGPLYFVLYVFFVFFILFNMFLAILDDAYGDVKEEMKEAKNDFEITDFLREKTEFMLSKLHIKRNEIIKMQKTLTKVDKNNDGKMDFDEWKEELKSRGYADLEIECLFARYDTDGDRVLDEKEQLDMLKELNDQKAALDSELVENQERLDTLYESESAKSKVSLDRYDVLSQRVDMINDIIVKLSEKFDVILENFQNMNNTILMGRESMELILYTLSSMNQCNEEERKPILETLINEELSRLSGETY